MDLILVESYYTANLFKGKCLAPAYCKEKSGIKCHNIYYIQQPLLGPGLLLLLVFRFNLFMSHS